tara:strand:- start:13664 stop:14245 length:582 start_codon:yes stop_codon:yes gene_type:complete
MRMISSRLCAPVAALALWAGLAFPPAAGADDQTMSYGGNPVWRDGRLAHLSKYIGTQNNRAVLDDPYVADYMRWELRDKYEAVRERLLSSPHVINYDLFSIVLGGSLSAKDNHIEAAILVVDLTNGGLYTGLESGGRTIVFGNRGPDENNPYYGELPWPLLFWVKQAELQQIGGEPPTKNFEWKYKAPPLEPR